MKKICTTIFLSIIGFLLIHNVLAQTSPSFPNQGDVRTIIATGALSTAADGCDPIGYYVFYEGSPIYLLVYSESLKSDSYGILNDSIARKYGNIFTGNLTIPFVSSVQPKKDTPNTPSNKIIVAQATGGKFWVPPGYSTPRTEIAGQLVTLTNYRLLRLTNPMRNYYFMNFLGATYSYTASANFSPNNNQKKACLNYYLGRCGDGVIDVAGVKIETPEGEKTWHSTSIIPSEQCDDGNRQNGDGCSSTCQLEAPSAPSCTSFTVNPLVGTSTTQYTLTCAGSGAASYQISIFNNGNPVPGTPLIYTGAGPFATGFGPLPAGNNVLTCTVYGPNGSNPSSCATQTVVVGTPTAPTCTLHAYTTGGTVIPDGSTVLANSAIRFRCEVTNGVSLISPGYDFSFTLGGQPLSTSIMPQVSSGYVLNGLSAGTLNALCKVYAAGGLSGSCGMSLNIGQVNPQLKITKTLLPNPLVPDGKYRPGDIVTFKIDFANIGTSPANNVKIRDVFPNALIHIATGNVLTGATTTPNFYGTYSNGTNLVIEYSGFSLPVGATGYMIVKGIVKGYEFANETYNHAYLVAESAQMVDAHAYFVYAKPNANLTINKTIGAGTYYPGSTVLFTITIVNNGDAINNLQIQDIWPNTPCIIPSNTYISNVPLQSNGNYSWTLNGSFNPGQTITITMTGQIKNDPICAVGGPYGNTAYYSYILGGITYTGSAIAMIPVSPTPYANIDFSKTILQAGSARGDTVAYKIIYKNNGTNTLNSFVINDFWPGTLNFVTSSPLPFNPPYGNSCIYGCTLTRYINTPLPAGAMGEIILTGTIK